MERHYLDGGFTEGAGGRSFTTLDPATGAVIAQVAAADAEDVNAAVDAARRAFALGPWPRRAASERAVVLRRIAATIRAHAGELVALECRDAGIPVARGSAEAAATQFEHHARAAPGGSAAQGGDALEYTLVKPVGVVAVLASWSAPLLDACRRLAPALAAGNTVVLASHAWAPLAAGRLAELLDAADLPTGVFNLLHGAAAALAAHPGVDLVRGEDPAAAPGRSSAAAGAPPPVSPAPPVVVFADADIERAVDAAVALALSAGARLLVERAAYERVAAVALERAAGVRAGDPSDPATQVGRWIHPEHQARVRAALANVRVLARGPLAVVEGAIPLVAPVLALEPFEDEPTVAHDTASLWTRDLARAQRVAAALAVRHCWINAIGTPMDDLEPYRRLETVHVAL